MLTTLLDAVRGWTPASGHWPTPDAAVSNDGEEPSTFLARKERHATKTDAEPTRAGVPLALAVKWATPTTPTGGSVSRGVLNPVFVEALMGWPLGWTDPTCRAGNAVPFPPAPNGDWASYLAAHPGTEPAVPKGEPLRTDRLRACGNGVVPAQAAAAFGELFAALAHPRYADLGGKGSRGQGVVLPDPPTPAAPVRGWRNLWRARG